MSTKSKYWIQDAIKHKGALRRTALKEGLLRNKDEKLSMSDLKKLEKMGGKTASRAHLAETLRKFDKGGTLLNKQFFNNVFYGGLVLDVFTVCRDYVDLKHNPDFTMGSHHYAPYSKYIPKGEIWIDDELGEIGREATIMHEVVEYYEMVKNGLDYSHAHEIALRSEKPILKKIEKMAFGGAIIRLVAGGFAQTKAGEHWDLFTYEIGGL